MGPRAPSQDRFARSFADPLTSDPEIRAMFGAWQSMADKPGATLDRPRAEVLDEIRRSGATAQDVAHVTRGAMRDDWAKDKILQFRVIFGKRDQYERFLELGRPEIAPRKPKTKGHSPPQPDSGWRPSPEMYLQIGDELT